jgi:L-asparaginase II
MPNNNPYLPIFELTRGKIVESIHYGAVAVVDSEGKLTAWYGDPQAVTFLRSSAKPFQVTPFIEHGGQSAYHLTLREIAIICASHSGTDEHVRVVKEIQRKTSVKESDLLCGTHPVSHKPTKEAMRERGEEITPNRHNCSGKHTGMLAYTRLKGLSIDPTGDQPYTDPAHPVQREILHTFAEMCGLLPDQVVVGIDGCSVPTFGIPLYNCALGYARLCDPSFLPEKRALACRTITTAMISNPDMVGGPDSFDTHLMETGQQKILCKGGAEGYQALGLLPSDKNNTNHGIGIAIKISDGDLAGRSSFPKENLGHIRPAVVLEVLRQLGVIGIAELRQLSDYGPTFTLQNWRKIEVGQGRPCFTLNFNNHP